MMCVSCCSRCQRGRSAASRALFDQNRVLPGDFAFGCSAPEQCKMSRTISPRRHSCGRMADYLSDATLLERFVTCREEAAFAALVQRHGPRVLGACRRILRNEHDAEDAFQATFLLLARKAADMPWRESVGGWLCAAAHRLSLNTRASVSRRRRRELPVAVLASVNPANGIPALPEGEDPHADPLTEIARRELRRVLDDELDRLPEKYRAPVVLCYLEGMTNEEAARARLAGRLDVTPAREPRSQLSFAAGWPVGDCPWPSSCSWPAPRRSASGDGTRRRATERWPHARPWCRSNRTRRAAWTSRDS